MKVLKYSVNRKTNKIGILVELSDEEMTDWNMASLNTPEKLQKIIKSSTDYADVIEAVFKAFDMPIEMMDKVIDAKEVGRYAKLVEIRRACMANIRRYTDLTFASIASIFNVHHASVIHHCKSYHDLLEIKDKKTVMADIEISQLMQVI